jgi:spectinomycin phosphotransferase
VRSHVPRETFADPTIPAYERELSELLQGTFESPAQRALQREVRPLADELGRDLRLYKALITQLGTREARSTPMVITHGDGPGNVLRDARGTIYLVDWDDVLAAPPERDTWFHLLDAEREAAFLPLYRRSFPEYPADRRFCAFYLYKRYFEDIEGLLPRVMSPTTDEADREEHLEYFRGDIEWLREPVRRLASG